MDTARSEGFVASAGGEVYHPADSVEVRNIPADERRWFATERAAGIAGYRRALSQPGLEEFELIEEIGRGGTASVFRARDLVLRRQVAIKVMNPAIGTDQESLARFAREARLVAHLKHPGVVSLYSVKQLPGGRLALVMEYVPGRTLRELIHADGPLPLPRVEEILRDVGAALAAAHAEGIVHRDIKPQNIFLHDVTGRALLADFGIAVPIDDANRITHTGLVIGTPAYMAPEQFEGGALDARSDLFGLGLVAWEMLSGRPPWEGENLYSIIRKQKEEELPAIRRLRPDLPRRVNTALRGALEKEPANRWRDVDEFLSVFLGESSRLSRLRSRMRIGRAGRKSIVPVPAALDRPREAPESAAPTVRFPFAGSDRPTGAARTVDQEMRGAPATAGAVPRQRGGWMAAAAVLLVIAASTAAGVAWHLREGGTERFASGDHAPGAAPEVRDSAASRPLSVFSPEAEIANPPEIGDGEVVDSFLLQGDSMFGGAPDEEVEPGGAEPGDVPGEEVLRSDDALAEADSVPEGPAAVPVLDVERATFTIAVGGMHTCVLVASTLSCWGGNERGQLGAGRGPRTPSPRQMDLGFTPRFAVAGAFHTCVVDGQGIAHCWGDNSDGQLGGGSPGVDAAPVPVPGVRFASLALGSSHSCGIALGGGAYCWGSDSHGQLGIGGTGGRAQPRAVETAESFVHIAAGSNHTCALNAAAQAFCWGRNTSGQLGDGTTIAQRRPVKVRGDLRFRALTAGSAHSCGITLDGEVFCWGTGAEGTLGSGEFADRLEPTRVQTSHRFVQLSAGSRHTCGVTEDRSGYCWGQNDYGQLGDDSTAPRPAPVWVRSVTGFTAIQANGSHTCGLGTDGEQYCWGYNMDGQIGDGTLVHRTVPERVAHAGGDAR